MSRRTQVLTPKYKCDIVILFGCKRDPIISHHNLELGDISDYVFSVKSLYPDCEKVKIMVDMSSPVWEQMTYLPLP